MAALRHAVAAVLAARPPRPPAARTPAGVPRRFGTGPAPRSRAFLLEDVGVGVPESERLSQLASPASWRHALEAEARRKDREALRNLESDAIGVPAAKPPSYSMAPRNAYYERATPRKLARRKAWPATPAGESILDPIYSAWGNAKAFAFAGIWVVLLLPAILGSILLSEPDPEPSPEKVARVLEAEAKATKLR
ncbi:hypothetical protein DFJ74DRAFT_655405 [Hyaloraphidium curvatum]|nr:hypothetical protein DFJ74DRAFT_655405 [Hyaloraphidium curvatum]